jgi:AcrR family transcriptional regulator
MSRTRRIDRAVVVDAAIALVNAEGPGALSLKRLADELGIQTPSLYNHVDGLPGLHRELALRNAQNLAGCLASAAIGRSGAPALAALAEAYREYIKANPGLYLLELRPAQKAEPVDPARATAEERTLAVCLAVMASLGLTGEDALHAVRALRSTVHGFATLETAGGFGLPLDLDESFRRLLDMLAHSLVPRV